MPSLLVVKIISLILIWLIAGAFGLLPILVEKLVSRGNEKHADLSSKIMTSLHFVAGGVFLGTILLHLMPSVEMQFTVAELGDKMDYPIAQLVIATGLIAFLFMEHFLIFWMDRMRKKGYNDMAGILSSDAEEVHFVRRYKEPNEYGTVTSDDATEGLHENLQKLKPPEDRENDGVDPADSTALPEGEPVSVEDYEVDQAPSNLDRTRLMRSYAIVIALSLHSVFEGMVIGFQKSHSGAWSMFGALAFHKALVAFSLGQKLSEVRDKITTNHVVGIVFVFSIMPPIGGIVATIMSTYNSTTSMQIARAILEGIATGSFMYVTFFDMLKFEAGQRLNVWYSLMIVLGFICVSVQMIFMPMSAMIIGSGHLNSTSHS